MPKIKRLIIIAAAGIGTFAQETNAGTLTRLGDLTQVIVPAYAFGLAMNEEGWAGAQEFALSLGATEIAVYGLKSIINEQRPNKKDNNSFPSGHTAAAFSGATFIHKRYGIKRAIIPYVLAAFTGYTRVAGEKHHWHDVIAGAAISSAMTWIFVSKYNIGATVSPDEMKLNFKINF